MKLTFIFSNGKTFIARGVDAESFCIAQNLHGVPVVSYVSYKEIPTADFKQQFPIDPETQEYAPVHRADGVYSDIVFAATDSETNQTEYAVMTTVDANRAALDYVIATQSSPDGHNSVNTIIAVRAPLSAEVLADALQLWC